MNKLNKFKFGAVAMTAFLIAPVALTAIQEPQVVYAAKGDKGPDWSKYQGSLGKFASGDDDFAIAQIGGYYNGEFIPQATYSTQVQYGIAQGKRMHTYIYGRFSGRAQADQMLNQYLPQIQTPKGSIVALDVEDGNPDTDSVQYALNRIKEAGYTPVLYGYKSFLTSHLDLAALAKSYVLWLGEYPDYAVRTDPDYNYFPSFDNIGMFQFTSTGVAGGLDYNIDLTGITDNGYTKNDNPKTETPAIEAGQQADKTPKKDISAGYTVKVNFSANKWTTGEPIPDWVKGNSYQVEEVSGDKVLLSGIESWISKSNVEILDTSTSSNSQSNSISSVYYVQRGDTLSGIAQQYGTDYWTLASVNGISDPNSIQVGQAIKVNGSSSSTVAYTVQSGDTLSGIANEFGTDYWSIANANGISNPDSIYPDQILYF